MFLVFGVSQVCGVGRGEKSEEFPELSQEEMRKIATGHLDCLAKTSQQAREEYSKNTKDFVNRLSRIPAIFEQYEIDTPELEQVGTALLWEAAVQEFREDNKNNACEQCMSIMPKGQGPEFGNITRQELEKCPQDLKDFFAELAYITASLVE